jgi:hypothetical protein
MTSTDTTKTTTTATVNKTATDAKPAKVGIAQITGHRDCFRDGHRVPLLVL